MSNMLVICVLKFEPISYSGYQFSAAATYSSRITYFSWLKNTYTLYLSEFYVHEHTARIELNSSSRPAGMIILYCLTFIIFTSVTGQLLTDQEIPSVQA